MEAMARRMLPDPVSCVAAAEAVRAGLSGPARDAALLPVVAQLRASVAAALEQRDALAEGAAGGRHEAAKQAVLGVDFLRRRAALASCSSGVCMRSPWKLCLREARRASSP